MDKAQKYTDKAIAQIDKLKNSSVPDDRRKFPPPLLSSFHVLLMEHIIQCRLVTGNKAGAIQVIFCFNRKHTVSIKLHKRQK
jgi:MAternally-affected-uncoordination protein